MDDKSDDDKVDNGKSDNGKSDNEMIDNGKSDNGKRLLRRGGIPWSAAASCRVLGRSAHLIPAYS
jgi:hypothetical protein